MSALTDIFDAIADAIRAKNGSSDTYTPAQMASAIEAIPSPDYEEPSTVSDLPTAFSNIADAIRTKLGVQTTYTPAQMPNAIASIPVGGQLDGGTVLWTNPNPDTYIGSTPLKVNISGVSEYDYIEVLGRAKYNIEGYPTTSGLLAVSKLKDKVNYDFHYAMYFANASDPPGYGASLVLTTAYYPSSNDTLQFTFAKNTQYNLPVQIIGYKIISPFIETPLWISPRGEGPYTYNYRMPETDSETYTDLTLSDSMLSYKYIMVYGHCNGFYGSFIYNHCDSSIYPVTNFFNKAGAYMSMACGNTGSNGNLYRKLEFIDDHTIRVYRSMAKVESGTPGTGYCVPYKICGIN